MRKVTEAPEGHFGRRSGHPSPGLPLSKGSRALTARPMTLNVPGGTGPRPPSRSEILRGGYCGLGLAGASPTGVPDFQG